MTLMEKSGKGLQPMLRYFRGLFPFLFVSLGYTLITLAWTMPLIEWQISGIAVDIPSLYETKIRPAWITKFGEALIDDRRFGIGDVSIVRAAAPFSDNCRNVDLVINRSQRDEGIEHGWLNVSNFFERYHSIWGWIGIGLAVLFAWWFTVSRQHRPADHAAILIIIAATFHCILLIVSRSVFSVTHQHHNLADDCYGAITLIATLSKIYPGPVAALFAGVCLQVAGIALMVKMVRNGKAL